jgi:carbamoyltransferase
MIGLGLNFGEFNSSAAAFVNEAITLGCAEERFNRQKKTKAFPRESIQFILDELETPLADVDFVACGWNPGCYWEKYNPLVSANRVRREHNLFAAGDHLSRFMTLDDRRTGADFTMVRSSGQLPDTYHVNHHTCHAANAYYLSPFDQAAVVTLDWTGEFETTTISEGSGLRLDRISSMRMPHSLGMFYATFTELLGYRSDSDEWKVMALAAYEPSSDGRRFKSYISGMVRLGEEGQFELDQRYFKGAVLTHGELFTEALVAVLGHEPQNPDWCIDIAWAMQRVAEEIGCHIMRWARKVTGLKQVAIGGGFAMNTVFNAKIQEREIFDEVYVPYAPSDLGNSIGAALYVAHDIKAQQRGNCRYDYSSSYIGPSYTASYMQSELDRRKLKYRRVTDDAVVNLLLMEQPVGFFGGRSEFGERALGNRSILASPLHASMKDTINACVKYREEYRPFAPVVPAEQAHRFFEVSENYRAPYMEKVVQVRPEYRDKLAAITHEDGSARLQTVTAKQNPRLHTILEHMDKAGRPPVLLNTSFNTSREPMVNSPGDAINTFFDSGLDHLIVGEYLVGKRT